MCDLGRAGSSTGPAHVTSRRGSRICPRHSHPCSCAASRWLAMLVGVRASTIPSSMSSRHGRPSHLGPKPRRGFGACCLGRGAELPGVGGSPGHGDCTATACPQPTRCRRPSRRRPHRRRTPGNKRSSGSRVVPDAFGAGPTSRCGMCPRTRSLRGGPRTRESPALLRRSWGAVCGKAGSSVISIPFARMWGTRPPPEMVGCSSAHSVWPAEDSGACVAVRCPIRTSVGCEPL